MTVADPPPVTQSSPPPGPTTDRVVGLGLRRPQPADAGGSAVSVIDAGLTYGNGVRALDGVTIHVPPGSHVAVLGPSGCGKTSLLGCLAGRLRVSDGSVACRGRVVTIHQDLRLVEQRSSLANVLDGCACRLPLWKTLPRFPKAERERATALLKRVGLGARMHTPVGRLSGGEKQRVAIARALMQDPVVLLADEPVAALDEANAEAVMRLLDALRRENGLTLVTVLHDRQLARRHADRAVGMESGRVIHDGPARFLPDAVPCGCDENGKPCDEPVNCERSAAAPTLSPVRPGEVEPGSMSKTTRRTLLGLAATFGVGVLAWSLYDLWPGARDRYNALPALARQISDLIPAAADLRVMPWDTLGHQMLRTLEMALVGTVLAVLVAWPLSALAAKNVGPRFVWAGVRFVLNAIRAVPSLVWALILVAPLGLTPAAGVAALVMYSLGYLTKFFYEAFENVDGRPPGALKEIGAGGLWRFGRAVWPASRPAVVTASLFMLEYNVRAASVLGIVGAGGIGQELKYHADMNRFDVVGVILVMLVVVVLTLDAASRAIRRRLVDG